MIGKAPAIDLLKEQCARYVNGFCHTRRCLVRGGYSDGPTVDHEATCEFHEAVVAIKERDRLRDAVEYAHSEGFEWPSDPMPPLCRTCSGSGYVTDIGPSHARSGHHDRRVAAHSIRCGVS